MDEYVGNDNYGRPKSEYLDKLVGKSDAELKEECGSMIWLSAFAANNARSDYHWQCDACYDECARRGRVDIYGDAYNEVVNEESL